MSATPSGSREWASATIAQPWSSPTTNPRRCRVRKPLPQATSSVRAGGNPRTSETRPATSPSHPGRSRAANRPWPRYHSSYSAARAS